ncbi:hypothetical protein AAFF_G00031260 [Aldrovandia affinis]|uniref:Tankyrase 1-binding protein C-terminal domain-containing protein n=1 Tax=Aldrovandia affinis TaxID=143900 RepID=A0AAD7S468_9TELE|nr:hypothetical protein AAFF_G00031260 [Aldrovandia affinis]
MEFECLCCEPPAQGTRKNENKANGRPTRDCTVSKQIILHCVGVYEEMEAQVKVGEVVGRVHLGPLADSSNLSPVPPLQGPEGPLILAPEATKPLAMPKPRLTAKPFSVQRSNTIRPISAPKPFSKPLPKPTPSSYTPNPPCTPKPDPASTPETDLVEQEGRGLGEGGREGERNPEITSSTPTPQASVQGFEPLNPGSTQRRSVRRPLSTDLTSRFESVGPQVTPRPAGVASNRIAPTQAREAEKGVQAAPSECKTSLAKMEGVRQKEKEEEEKDREEEKSRGSIKSRISLLLDSTSSGSVGSSAPSPGAEPHSSTQLIADKEVLVGVKQRIKELTTETLPVHTPSPRTAFKPRPLSHDLTKCFAVGQPGEPSDSLPSIPGGLERDETRGWPENINKAHRKEIPSNSGEGPDLDVHIGNKVQRGDAKDMKSSSPREQEGGVSSPGQAPSPGWAGHIPEKDMLNAKKEIERLEQMEETMEEERVPIPAPQGEVGPGGGGRDGDVRVDDFSVKPGRWGGHWRVSNRNPPSQEPPTPSEEQNRAGGMEGVGKAEEGVTGREGEVERERGGEKEGMTGREDTTQAPGDWPTAEGQQDSDHTPASDSSSTQKESLLLPGLEEEPDETPPLVPPSPLEQMGEPPQETEGSTQTEVEGEETLVREAEAGGEAGDSPSPSLAPATQSADDVLNSLPREPSTPSDPETGDTHDSTPCEPLPFPEVSTPLLDSTAQLSKAELSRRRRQTRRSLPSRSVHRSITLELQEHTDQPDDWRFRDSTAMVECEEGGDSDSEQPRGAVPCPPQPQRVPIFPGMDPSALKAVLRKRGGDSDRQTESSTPSPSHLLRRASQLSSPAPSPSQLSRSPKSPRMLPPAAGTENREESAPPWLQELKSKKRFSQCGTDT